MCNDNCDIVDTKTFRCIGQPAVLVSNGGVILDVGDYIQIEDSYRVVTSCLLSSEDVTDEAIAVLDSTVLMDLNKVFPELETKEIVQLLNYLQDNLNGSDVKHYLRKDGETLKMLLATE